MELSIYIHIPFCQRRCTYCDFATWDNLGKLIEPYAAAVKKEIMWLEKQRKWHAKTLYFGGGTPSILAGRLIASIIQTIDLADTAEVTLEANPGTLSDKGLVALRKSGVNRLSIGMQSANANELAMLGRIHDLDAVEDSVLWARNAGFNNLSLDLMFGLPGQRLDDWKRTLRTALHLEPQHLSLYALSLDPGTKMKELVNKKKLPEPDQDLAADMYNIARDFLSGEGFLHYEISNWSLPEYSCSHNLAYWENQPYLGIGAAAWGHWMDGPASLRLSNVNHPRKYIHLLDDIHYDSDYSFPITPANITCERVESKMAMAETMFMGLRLLEKGVSRTRFQMRFGIDPVHVYGKQLQELEREELVTVDDECICLTPDAVLIGNQIFSVFLPDD
ncbi:MAG: radical SAM family heme chaperone HemW [Anaerolineales bacterium]|nr:radical SAM family heme chaperone HemW [Anaerolineales bacterium]